MFRQLTIRARFENEIDRMRDMERLIAWMHTIVIPPTVIILLVGFPFVDPRWITVAILGTTTIVSWTALSRPLTARGLRNLGWFTILADTALIVLSMFLFDVDPVTRGIYFCGVLVIIEAAARFQIWGGLFSGLLFAGASVGWLGYRGSHLDEPFDTGTAMLLAMMFIVVGLVIGVIINGLEQARRSLWRRVQQAELVNRFAIESPQRSESENVQALAELLATELSCSSVRVLLHDPSTARLHAVGVAGTAVEGESYEAGLSMAEHEHPVVRAFHQGATVVIEEPDESQRIAVPLKAGGRNLGAIYLHVPGTLIFSDDEVVLLDVVAGELAQVLENVRLGDVQRETIDELKRLTELKDDFITVASHELRTPLTAMRGFVRALKDVRANPEQSERAVAAIDRQVERMHRLVEDLISVSLIDSGRSTPFVESVDLVELAERVWRDVDPGKGTHTFEAQVATEVAIVAADPAFLKRILDNLMANAVEFSPDGGMVTLRARVEGAGDDAMAYIEIIDEGVGIQPAEIDQLFEKFVRLESNKRPEGTGLGLYIVRGLVRSMGGSTGVSSRPGAGSCFSFTVPLVASSSAPRSTAVSSPDSAGR
jgi:signal transduction histidine kinase